MHPPSRSSGPLYGPRQPESTVLYRVLQEHLETFIARSEASGRELPVFVKNELRGYLECGIMAHGFARYRCGDCGHSRWLPFSCGGRGFCPSCTGRRMADQAAHLVDHVLPHAPVRQWVLSLPFDLRALVAFRGELRKLVLREFMRAVYRWLRGEAREKGEERAHCGAVIFVQRFGSDLRLNLHFHALVLDGVYSESEHRELAFLQGRAPEPDDLRAISARIHRRLARVFEREGVSIGGQLELETDAREELLLQLAGASAAGMIAQGPRSGKRVPPWEHSVPPPRRARSDTSVGGFNLHAGVATREEDRQGLENRHANYDFACPHTPAYREDHTSRPSLVRRDRVGVCAPWLRGHLDRAGKRGETSGPSHLDFIGAASFESAAERPTGSTLARGGDCASGLGSGAAIGPRRGLTWCDFLPSPLVPLIAFC